MISTAGDFLLSTKFLCIAKMARILAQRGESLYVQPVFGNSLEANPVLYFGSSALDLIGVVVDSHLLKATENWTRSNLEM